MAGNRQATRRMVADVGGTNSRIALYDQLSDEFRCLRNYVNRDHPSFEAVIARWLSDLGEPPPEDACLAVAAPPDGDRVEMSNIDWSFSARELAARFEFRRCHWVNDFQANAYALPHLDRDQREQLQADCHIAGRLAVIGPGTGLGGATLDSCGSQFMATACEPGHMGISPGNDLELALFQRLLARHSDVYSELLVSGPGLARLYQSLGEINGIETRALEPADITQKALAGEDQVCVQALATFCGLLGSICGDFVLATGAYGGVYLAGGIVPRILPFLRQSDFLQRFSAKGVMGPHLRRVAVQAITTAQPGLIGAAHAPLPPA
jgi:glucokinase